MCNFSVFCSEPCFVYFYSLQLTCILAAGRRWRYGQARRYSMRNEGEPVASRSIDLKIRCNTSVIGCIRCVFGVIGCISCVLGVIGVYYLYSLVIGVIFGSSCNSFWR